MNYLHTGVIALSIAVVLQTHWLVRLSRLNDRLFIRVARLEAYLLGPR